MNHNPEQPAPTGREAFEAYVRSTTTFAEWPDKEGLLVRIENGTGPYYFAVAGDLWRCWQAALSSAEPQPVATDEPDVIALCAAYDKAKFPSTPSPSMLGIEAVQDAMLSWHTARTAELERRLAEAEKGEKCLEAIWRSSESDRKKAEQERDDALTQLDKISQAVASTGFTESKGSTLGMVHSICGLAKDRVRLADKKVAELSAAQAKIAELEKDAEEARRAYQLTFDSMEISHDSYCEELRSRLSQSPWIACKDRMPTKEDARPYPDANTNAAVEWSDGYKRWATRYDLPRFDKDHVATHWRTISLPSSPVTQATESEPDHISEVKAGKCCDGLTYMTGGRKLCQTCGSEIGPDAAPKWEPKPSTSPDQVPLEAVVDRPPDGRSLDYYVQPYYCTNCGTHQKRWILKGVRKPDSVICHNCQCSTSRP